VTAPAAEPLADAVVAAVVTVLAVAAWGAVLYVLGWPIAW
jgi:hypothetical protein